MSFASAEIQFHHPIKIVYHTPTATLPKWKMAQNTSDRKPQVTDREIHHQTVEEFSQGGEDDEEGNHEEGSTNGGERDESVDFGQNVHC